MTRASAPLARNARRFVVEPARLDLTGSVGRGLAEQLGRAAVIKTQECRAAPFCAPRQLVRVPDGFSLMSPTARGMAAPTSCRPAICVGGRFGSAGRRSRAREPAELRVAPARPRDVRALARHWVSVIYGAHPDKRHVPPPCRASWRWRRERLGVLACARVPECGVGQQDEHRARLRAVRRSGWMQT